jgi:DNA invertase Pin-like site-specific DNA recombinase
MAKKKRKPRTRPPLDERHYRAIELLALKRVHNTLDDIAAGVGVDRRTLYRWRQRKDFDKELRKARRKMIAERRRKIPRTNFRAFTAFELTEWYRSTGVI